MTPRTATLSRKTAETEISINLNLDLDTADTPAAAAPGCDTGLPFLDHMLAQLARHGRLGLSLTCRGDVRVDDHHTVEDCALCLGEALHQALGDRRGIRRFGSAYAPLDEALVRAVVDLSGRPWPEIHLPLTREKLGDVATENLLHFLRSLAMAARMTLHIDLIRGENDHHKIEAAFKALALALRQAIAVDAPSAAQAAIPSTKGVLV